MAPSLTKLGKGEKQKLKSSIQMGSLIRHTVQVNKAFQQKSQKRFRLAKMMERAEKRILIAWIRFARARRDSDRLPLVLFLLLFFDAFVMVIPSMILVAAAITITPRRWWLFATCFVLATVSNNLVTYWIGRAVPVVDIVEVIDFMGIGVFWENAQAYILQYGPIAALPGALAGLPTQLITLAIGVADSQEAVRSADFNASIGEALAWGSLGHGLKIFLIAGLVRYGWVKLEKKYGNSAL